VVVVVVVVVVAATPNYLRQASQNLGKYRERESLMTHLSNLSTANVGCVWLHKNKTD
jgi:hypothetical protein